MFAMMIVLLSLMPAVAHADITAFLGLTTTPESRLTRGVSFGFGLLVVGFEFEYATTGEDELDLAPGLTTGSGNALVQTPIAIAGLQFYATAGGGLFRERLLDQQETHFATNLGGGVKVRLLGPLRLRADYRLFRLRGSPLYSTYHRVYAGANVGF